MTTTRQKTKRARLVEVQPPNLPEKTGDGEIRAAFNAMERAVEATRHRRRVNYTLAPRTIAALQRTGNASRYLDAIVQQRARAWRRALETLLRSGWTLEEVRGQVEHGTHRRPDRRIRVLAAELEAGNEAVQMVLDGDLERAEVARG